MLFDLLGVGLGGLGGLELHPALLGQQERGNLLAGKGFAFLQRVVQAGLSLADGVHGLTGGVQDRMVVPIEFLAHFD